MVEGTIFSNKTKWVILSVNAPVDDVGFLRDSLGGEEGFSCELISVQTIDEGLRYLKENDVDLVLFDFSPSRDEIATILDFVKKIKGKPVIVLSDTSSEGVVKEFLLAGVDEYLVKAEINASYFLRTVQFSLSRSLRMKNIILEMERLSGVERSLYSIVDKNMDALIIVDKDGVVLYVNRAAEILFGRSKEGFEGEMFEFTIEPDKASEIEAVRPGGERLLLQMRAKEIEWKDKRAFLVSFYDITELVRIREEMRALSLVDETTGFYNYRGFVVLAQQQAKLSQRRLKGMFLIEVSLLNFEEINEVFGPYEREHALEELGVILKSTFRRSDIIGRIDKSRFAILAIDANENSKDIIVNRLNENIDKFNASHKLRYEFVIETKAAYYNPSSPVEIEELMRRVS